MGDASVGFSSSTTVASNPYKFSVYRNSAASVAVSFTKVTFDTEDYDSNNNFASGTYTAPVAGFYNFEWNLGLSTAAGNAVSAIYKNGSVYAWGAEVASGGNSGGAIPMFLAATDTIEIYGSAAGTATLNVGGSPRKTYFSGYLISRA